MPFCSDPCYNSLVEKSVENIGKDTRGAVRKAQCAGETVLAHSLGDEVWESAADMLEAIQRHMHPLPWETQLHRPNSYLMRICNAQIARDGRNR
jgi:hypothetical protein